MNLKQHHILIFEQLYSSQGKPKQYQYILCVWIIKTELGLLLFLYVNICLALTDNISVF